MVRVVLVCIAEILLAGILRTAGLRIGRIPHLVWLYLAGVNLITFFLFMADKHAARKDRRRIRVATLLGFAFAGGTPCALIGMYLLHHKTRKSYFAIGVPLMLIAQIICVLALTIR